MRFLLRPNPILIARDHCEGPFIRVAPLLDLTSLHYSCVLRPIYMVSFICLYMLKNMFSTKSMKLFQVSITSADYSEKEKQISDFFSTLGGVFPTVLQSYRQTVHP